ncbi:MAG TPA: FAD-dependent oxidoreductase [Nitriliruptoraceae bacterium]|nr:FAD-dependent oxidoreductase [Nitriliruptoraceae bacterium]
MADIPSSANVVVIGAGIVGNFLVGHLSRLGWTDIVQIDKGPLPNPGGSTGHASNFIFPVDHNKEMALLTLESQRQYEELGVQVSPGGIEVARTEERMEELLRRMTSARAWGIESELLTPAQVKELVPFIEEDVILGGFHTPSVSVVDSLRAGTLMRDEARDAGNLQVFPNTEVLDLETEPNAWGAPRITAVVTDRGRIEADAVVVACGVWSPRIAEMAGATIPLIPTVHQMADVGPIEILQETGTEIAFPIVRDMDTFMYERQAAGSMEVGSYAHRPIFHAPDEIPSNDEAALTPTEMPFTDDDFDDQLEDALELMPSILETAEIRYAINGLLSLTPDAMPLLGETIEVTGLWSAAAVWIKEGPGIAQLVAEWMTHGYPHIADPHGSDIARLYHHERSDHHVRARCAEHFNKTYGIVHPREQWESQRNMQRSPFWPREVDLGATFFAAHGWERPQWYESNADLVDRYGVADREVEWDARWWSPIINGEHLHLRDKVGMVDLTAFQVFDFTGPGVLDYIERMTVNKCDQPVGRSIYTPVLATNGGFRSDLTVLRLGERHFRVITGAFDGGRDAYWFTRNLPDDGSVRFDDITSRTCTIGVWGPDAQAMVAKVCEADLSQEAFPYASVQTTRIAGIPVTMFRISYVGDNGWEITTDTSHGLALWDALAAAGEEFEVRPVGIGVYGTTGRIEKGYRLMGAELESEYTPVEAGLARRLVKAADFIGKEPYLAAREEEPAAILCTLTMDDQADSQGRQRYPMGGNEPILTPDGERIVDARGRVSVVTTAGAAPSLGAYLLMAYLPPEHAVGGTSLQVMYQNELFPVTVAEAGSTPLFDPTNERMKG